MDDYHDSIGKPFWELSVATWESTMNVGFRSHFVATQMAAREASAAELRASLEGLWDKVKVQCAPSSQP